MRQSYLKNAALMTGADVLLRLAGMGLRIYLANALGGEGMGLYQLVLAVYALFVTLATAGVSVAATRLMAEELSRGRAEARGMLVRLALAGCHAALSECGSRAVFVGSPGAGRACGIVCPLDFVGGKNGQPPAVSGGFLQPPVAAGSDPVDCTGLGAHPAWI